MPATAAFDNGRGPLGSVADPGQVASHPLDYGRVDRLVGAEDDCHQLGTRVSSELGHRVAHMSAHCLWRDIQLFGDLITLAAEGDKGDDFSLAGGQQKLAR